MPGRKAPLIANAILDQLLAGADARPAFEKESHLGALKKALAERPLNAEWTTISTAESRTAAATPATAMASRPCRATQRRLKSLCPGIVFPPSTPR